LDKLAEDLHRNLISHLFDRQDSSNARISVPLLSRIVLLP